MNKEVDEYFMRLALKEAGLAFLEGEIPIGAILLDKEGRVVASAHNRKESLKDPTAHAEIIALREGAVKMGSWRLTGTTLYVTKEPCIMCAGAIINSRVERVVYGCPDPKGGAVESLYNMLNDRRLNHQVNVTSGILKEESSRLLKKFFDSLR